MALAACRLSEAVMTRAWRWCGGNVGEDVLFSQRKQHILPNRRRN